MGWPGAGHRSGARCAILCRAGQPKQSGRAVHLPCRRRRSLQRSREHRIGDGRSVSTCPFNIAEGRTMNLLGKLDWNALPLHEPIIMGATAFMVLVVVAVLGFITIKGAWLYL